MTTHEIDNEISSLQRQIRQLLNEIDKAENEIAELNEMERSITDISDTLHASVNKAFSRVSGFTSLFGKVTSFLNSSFFNNLSDAITGHEYTEADNGLNASVEAVVSKKKSLNTSIENWQLSISSMRDRIAFLEQHKISIREQESMAQNQTSGNPYDWY